MPKLQQHNQMLVFRAAGASDIGKRMNNEDAYLINEDIGLFVVCDGVGGGEKGEVASRFASAQLDHVMSSLMPPEHEQYTLDPGPLDATPPSEELLETAIVSVNLQLWQENKKVIEQIRVDNPNLNEEAIRHRSLRKKMGTTLVSLLFQGDKAYITNIGDSRVYHIVRDSIAQLSHDHSWIAERMREGIITEEQAKYHPKRSVVTRSLGARAGVDVDLQVLTAYQGDRFLLCSDGLSNVLSQDELLHYASQEDIAGGCASLVKLAKERGGRDNITAVLVEVIGKKKAVDVTFDDLEEDDLAHYSLPDETID